MDSAGEVSVIKVMEQLATIAPNCDAKVPNGTNGLEVRAFICWVAKSQILEHWIRAFIFRFELSKL